MLIIDQNLEIRLLLGQGERLSNELILKNMGKMVTRYLRATRKNDTYARPHPHQIHCAQMSCHGEK